MNSSSPSSPLADRNPFATRATQPGALVYRFLPGNGPARLVDQLRDNHWWGEIIGPHGSGKSALLQALVSQLHASGRSLQSFVLHHGDTQLPVAREDLRTWDTTTQVVVDGFEQLGVWQRARLKKTCREQGSGLLVTAHTPLGLPLLYRTRVTVDLACELAAELMRSSEPVIRPEDVAASFQRHEGNLRELFFELYDLYESRRLP